MSLKAAVVGCGGWGRVHVEAYWRLPGVELVGVCGQYNRQRTERTAQQYGATAFMDIDEMIEKAAPDVVSVITPDDQHFTPYLKVLAHNVHVMLEKPLALDGDEGRRILLAARAKKRLCGINFNHRYATPFQMARRAVDEGCVGQPFHVLWRFTGFHGKELIAQHMAHVLFMQCHGFNMLTHFAGPIAAVNGMAFDPRGTEQATTACFNLQFESGAIGSFVASVDGDYKDPDVYRFEMMGENGRIVVLDAIDGFAYYPRTAHVAGEQFMAQSRSWKSHFFEDDARSFERTTDRHLIEFLDAIRRGDPEPIPIEEGIDALRVGLAAIEAARTGQTVPVKR
jgi:predicted dehydrogenase